MAPVRQPPANTMPAHLSRSSPPMSFTLPVPRSRKVSRERQGLQHPVFEVKDKLVSYPSSFLSQTSYLCNVAGDKGCVDGLLIPGRPQLLILSAKYAASKLGPVRLHHQPDLVPKRESSSLGNCISRKASSCGWRGSTKTALWPWRPQWKRGVYHCGIRSTDPRYCLQEELLAAIID